MRPESYNMYAERNGIHEYAAHGNGAIRAKSARVRRVVYNVLFCRRRRRQRYARYRLR